MSENKLKDILIRNAVRLMLDGKLSGLTPALILAAAFQTDLRGAAWDAPSSSGKREQAEQEYEELRKYLTDTFVMKYYSEESVRAVRRAFDVFPKALMMIAAEEDKDSAYAALYQKAVRKNGAEGTVPGLVRLLCETDDSLKDEGRISACLKKVWEADEAESRKKDAAELFPIKKETDRAEISRICLRMQEQLQSLVFGQDEAIDSLVQGYMQYLSSMQDDAKHTPVTFLFAGPSGTGKSSLAKAFKDLAGLPFKQFDMTQFADHQAQNILIGFLPSYRNSAPGTLTSFVKEHPACVLLFDEIEKAHVNVKNLFLQVLEDSVLHDDFENLDVDFSRTILIFTTNAGRSLYENTERKLSTLSRDTVVSAIGKEYNDSGSVSIPSALLSRFAAGNIIMFDDLGAASYMEIIRSRFDACIREYQKSDHIEITYDDRVIPSVLYSTGSGADARKVSAAGSSFIRGQMMSLFRKLSAKTEYGGSGLKKVRFTCDTGSDVRIRDLFTPEKHMKTLFFGFKKKYVQTALKTLDRALSADDALQKLSSGGYEMLLCDIGYWHIEKDPANRKKPLSESKKMTNGRLLMERVLEEYPSVPVYVLEDAQRSFDLIDRMELRRQGVRGFLNIDDPSFAQEFHKCMENIAQEKKLFELTRSNSTVSFNTIEYVSENGEEAEIDLCEYSIGRNILAQDIGSVLDKLSMPSDTFDDVIGQEHVKQEMRFFINYLKDPQRFRNRLNAVPRGLLLYGPAGTGKTMLAKAFAHEAGLAFVSSQGNEFTSPNGANDLHRVFSAARRYAPAVIFIDEIDALARARTGTDPYRENALTALLTEMDGFSTDSTRPVFVIAATNYMTDDPVMRLDPAVLRRFDNRLFVDLPDKEDRLKVLQKEIVKHADLFDLSEAVIENTAARTAGRSFAWIRSMINMVIRTMIMKDWDIITDSRFEDAFEEFSGGREHSWSEDVLLETARHEAGHALIMAYNGTGLSYITITSRGSYGGYAQAEYDENKAYYSSEDIFREICVCLGGRAAEIVCYGKGTGINTGASSDLSRATALAQDYVASYGMDEEFGMAVFAVQQDDLHLRKAVNAMLEKALEQDIAVIQANRKTLDALTDALMKKNHLNKAEIGKILQEAPLARVQDN